MLKKITTDEVFQAWLDLPGRIEMLAFNTMQEGLMFDKEVVFFNTTLLNGESLIYHGKLKE